ncbi:MAG: RNA methyltransferase [Clostridiales bacterium]|jgi:TrmH family RNA methyltransferase|nr:RNA methyltransferase [Clostridiales bacterium]
MERISSRKNKIIIHMKNLGADSSYRRNAGEFLCDGEKLLREALDSGADISCVLWGGEKTAALPHETSEYSCPAELIQNISPLKNSSGPLFSVKIPVKAQVYPEGAQAIILENLQDPGNVGTVIRTAKAMGTELVILVGDCADIYNPKTVRATMGAVFRQKVSLMSIGELKDYVSRNGLRLIGAALSDKAEDIRKIDMGNTAVAIGSEGSGLSKELLSICEGEVIIPMQPESESLNAAVAASIVMWEMSRNR